MSKVSIDQAKKMFEEWRKNRKGRGAAPPELRRIALDIKKRHGERIAHEELRLSSHTLWSWTREQSNGKPKQSLQDKPAQQVKRNRKQAARMEFVDVTPKEAYPPGFQSGLTVEWQRLDGARMRISGALNMAEVETLANRFLGANGVCRS
jgi:hypothetical protein